MKTITILSGGLDSTTLLYDLLVQGDEVHALGFNYGQRHAKELVAAEKICRSLNVPFRNVDLTPIRSLLAGSSQTSDEIAVPEGHYEEESMKLTVVPNRNLIMLSVAAGYAISLKADRIAYGAHGGDHAIYPDCRPAFVEELNRLLPECDWHKLTVYAPYLGLTKTGIVARGAELGVPFGDTWSCYKGGEVHCGKCGTCVERREAFEQAGISDLTPYEVAAEE